MDPRSNTRRNCDYCVEKKVRCSGRIEGGACHYCARKDHVCVFSLKQKPGPKCNRHIGEGAPPFREESLGVDAISSAAAALSLSGSKPGLAAAMAWSQSAKGKRGGRGSTSRAFSAADKRPFAPGSVGDGIGNRDHVMDEAGGGPPAASFLDVGCYGGGGRAANGDSTTVLPPTPIDGKVGGSSGSFLEFPHKPAAFEASAKEDELIDELLGQLETEEDAVEAQQDPQQEQKPHKQLTPPPKKKVKVNQISGPDQAGPDNGLRRLWNQAAPAPPCQAVAAPPRDAASASRPPRPGSLNPAITATQRVVSAAAASAAAATMTTEAAAAAAVAAAAASAVVTATGPAGVAATGSTVQQEQQQQQQPRPLSRIKSINSNGNGSWRRLLNHRSSFILENGGDVCGPGGGLLTSCSSWSERGGGGGGGDGVSRAQSPVFEINDVAAEPFGEPAALATAAAGPVQQRGFQGSAGGLGAVAEPLQSVTHVRTLPYGMTDWLLPAGVTPNGDLLEAVSGVPAAGMLTAADNHGAVPPLAGGGGAVSCGVVTGGDYQF
ncbi:hypothetical protein Esi_0348_0008 [Ectocarpus siliculosus]|uniref:Zn(2)-C6 fungal-type domain-containing protein n=1 Tax=Ectocarpus siliculosus TaxID=2880 RepID=D7FYM9_ECTSI|nr:hypothetical protein Esi_0348_0008 [Ectocarpus siliculosus]|eukprot:CBJ32571.1 hypothetical protein Esi_0348_0008 [Ectocarpus siliculosus]